MGFRDRLFGAPGCDKRRRAPNATGHPHIGVCALWEPRCPWQPPTKNGAIHVPRATFWHGGLRKDKWECLMNACFYGASGIAAALCSQRRDVMSASHSPLAPHIQAFFTDHLCRHKRASPQTVASCRDSFRLLLTFVKETTGIEPSALRVADLDAPTLLAFLDHLEQQRGNSIRSRNIRLSALRTFFRFVAL